MGVERMHGEYLERMHSAIWNECTVAPATGADTIVLYEQGVGVGVKIAFGEKGIRAGACEFVPDGQEDVRLVRLPKGDTSTSLGISLGPAWLAASVAFPAIPRAIPASVERF